MKNTRTKIDINHTIITHANLVAERHEAYVNEFVTRANSELYAILAEMLELHEKMCSSATKEKLIKQMKKHLKERYNLKIQANTKTTALVVKYVTRSSRKTAHVYSRVLDIAISNGIGSADLVEFIKSKGGIDKVRVAVDSAEVQKQHKDREKLLHKVLKTKLLQQKSIGNVVFPTTIMSLPIACDVKFHHLLCHFNMATNAYEIIGVMYPSSVLETQAMSEYLTMLDVATSSDHDTLFYQRCKELGLNMDIMHNWMRANNIADAAAARCMGTELIDKAILQISANKVAPLQLTA